MDKEKIKAGWELHKLTGGSPGLRWFLDARKELEAAETAPAELKQKAEEWLRSYYWPHFESDYIIGISFSAIFLSAERRFQEIFDILQDYGLVDETETSADYRPSGRKYQTVKTTKGGLYD
jgi:hypothetical protein